MRPLMCIFTTSGESKIIFLALAGVAQWTEHRPVNQRVASSIPGQGTCLGCGPRSNLPMFPRISMFLCLSFFLPSILSKSK